MFKKYRIYLIIMVVFLLCLPSSVNALQDKDGNVSNDISVLPKATLADRDYEITCIYDNGMSITITRRDSVISTVSNNKSSSDGNVELFYLKNQQNDVDKQSGKITHYNIDNFLNAGKCPQKLYAYYLDESDNEDANEEAISGSVYGNMYLYSTASNIADKIAGETPGWYCFGLCNSGSRADRRSDMDVILVSESVNLMSNKKTTICDYVIRSLDDETKKGNMTASIYLFSNISFLQIGNYVTSLDTIYTSCPAKLNSILYINSPEPRMVESSNSMNLSYNYVSKRYFIEAVSQNDDGRNASISECSENNDNDSCSIYNYLGERNGSSDGEDGNKLCTILGGRLVEIIKEVVKYLQIIVPVIVIVLTGIDIGKIIVSGNLEEDLPKKKKLLIIRFIVMIIFFFLPAITDIIVELLATAGLIGIEKVECLFK